MSNPRVTPKERGLLKGAIRRVFSRSELRRRVIDAAEIKHSDPNRPRLTRWVLCAACREPCAKYQAQVDHLQPIVPISTTLEAMTWDNVINNAWCEEKFLQVLCKKCHTAKTKAENAERRRRRKEMKDGKSS